MELRRYLSILRRRMLLILAIVVAALAAGWLITPRTHQYTASSTLYVGSAAIGSGDISGDRVAGFDRVIKTFTAMLPSEKVVRAGVSSAGVDRSVGAVAGVTQAAPVENTNLIKLSVTDNDPAAARGLANGIADAFVRQINKVEPATGQTSHVLSVYERAWTPSAPDPSNLLRNLVLALLLGLVIAGSVVGLLEHLDISFRSIEDVERRLELPVLGVLPSLGSHMPVPPAARVQAPTSGGAAHERGAPLA